MLVAPFHGQSLGAGRTIWRTAIPMIFSMITCRADIVISSTSAPHCVIAKAGAQSLAAPGCPC